MDRRLEGEVCVVTGGGAGIGEATCVLFAEEGGHVVAVDRYLDDAEETVSRIEEAGGPEALAVECDVADEGQVEAMARTVEERFGRVDVLVNNAGIRVEPKPVTEADEDSWDRILDVNLKGMARCAKHVVPLMDSGGSVVNVASVCDALARKGWAQYDATKGGIVALSRDMAADHADDGIRVNALSPGGIVSDYHIGDRTGEERERFVEEQTTPTEDGPGILGRKGTPRECAHGILFLASDEASFVTGANLKLDGGQHVTGLNYD